MESDAVQKDSQNRSLTSGCESSPPGRQVVRNQEKDPVHSIDEGIGELKMPSLLRGINIESRNSNGEGREEKRARPSKVSFDKPSSPGHRLMRESERISKEMSDKISWLLWKLTSKIREPILYLIILILAIVYLQLSPTVIGLSDQADFRNDIEDLISENPLTSSIDYGPSTLSSYQLCPERSYSAYKRTAPSADALNRGFREILWMFQFARLFDNNLGCRGCSFRDLSLHNRAGLTGMWLRTQEPPSTAINNERIYLDFSFHDGFLYNIQESGEVSILGHEETQGVAAYSRSIQHLYNSGNCLEKYMERNALDLEVDLDFPYINETECFSSEGMLAMSRQFLCGEDFRTFLNSLIEGYNRDTCSRDNDAVECVDFQIYIPLLLRTNTVCDVDYLAMVIYDTKSDDVEVRFVPEDLYPPKCRVFYFFSQVFVFILVFSLTVFLKCMNAVAHYNIIKQDHEGLISALKKIISKLIGSGWFWLDCIVYVLAAMLIVSYSLYLHNHSKLFNDFEFEILQRSSEEVSESENSVLAILQRACEDSKANVNEWGENSSTYPAFCYLVPILFETWGIAPPEEKDWLLIRQDLDQLIGTSSSCTTGNGIDCVFGFDDTTSCEQIVADECFPVYQNDMRSYLEIIAQGIEVPTCTERDRLLECTFNYYNSIHKWMFDPLLDSNFPSFVEQVNVTLASIFDQDSKKKTEQFHKVFDHQTNYQTITAYLILFLCIRLLRYSSVDSRLELILNSLKRASVPMTYFFLAFIIVFVGFVVFAQLFLGFYGVDGYESFGDSFVTSTILLFNPFDLDEISFLSDSQKDFFYIWYYLFLIILVLTFMNFIIAILVISLEEEWERMKGMKIQTLRSSFMRFVRLMGRARTATAKKRVEGLSPKSLPLAEQEMHPEKRIRYVKVLSSAIMLYETSAENLISAAITIQSYFRGYCVRKKLRKSSSIPRLGSRESSRSNSALPNHHFTQETVYESNLRQRIDQVQQELTEVKTFMKETADILKQLYRSSVGQSGTVNQEEDKKKSH